MTPTLPIIALLLASAAAGTAQPLAISNQEIGFSLTIPDGFQQVDPAQIPNPQFLYLFQSRAPLPGIAEATIAVERLNGTLGRHPLDLNTVLKADPGLTDAQAYTETWKTFQIQAIRGYQVSAGSRMAMCSAQVPLKSEAIQVFVAGPSESASQVAILLHQVIQSLEGESNWLTDAQSAEKLGEGAGRLAGWILGAAIVGYAVRRRSRRRQAALS